MPDEDDNMSSGGSDDSSRAKPKPPSQTRKNVRKAGEAMSKYGQDTLRDVASQASARSNEPSPNSTPRYMNVDSYKRGGKVKRTGPARLHKGERVVKRGGKRRRMSGRS